MFFDRWDVVGGSRLSQRSSSRSIGERKEFIDAEKDAATDTGEKKYTITAMCAHGWVCRV